MYQLISEIIVNFIWIIVHIASEIMQLKVVQTRLTSIEYELLRKYAESRGLTIAEALREIVRKQVLEGEVHADDPLFTKGPVVRGKRIEEEISERHDEFLYGARA